VSESLILGGTKGLGLELARESSRLGILPIICGRSVYEDSVSKNFPPGAERLSLDLADDYPDRNLNYVRRMAEEGKTSYFFWNAGIFSRKSFTLTDEKKMDIMINIHLRGPLRAILEFHRAQKNPYHLVVIASTSSWRLRENETIYCALKAAKAAFARNFAGELARDLPGSKVTLVNPGGLKTPNFWSESGQDISKFMEPETVAKIIWDEVRKQTEVFKEIQIIRNDDGSPRLEYGPKLPELPK